MTPKPRREGKPRTDDIFQVTQTCCANDWCRNAILSQGPSDGDLSHANSFLLGNFLNSAEMWVNEDPTQRNIWLTFR